jgi:uncharacterized membrane protein YdjX (TVP38/TMEM64 family)
MIKQSKSVHSPHTDIAVVTDISPQKLRPFSESVRDLPAGWLIPVAILVVISFPPLFGHEIVALLVGVVYGLWIGFAIVAAGTFIGEGTSCPPPLRITLLTSITVGTWFAFKYAFRSRALKLERSNLNYGALARLTRDGGFFIVLVIRLSAIPAHFSTAVFSTCDVKFWHFSVATLLSLPKQIFLVYLGVLLVQDSNDSIVKTVMFGIVFLITVALGLWIYIKMRTIKKTLLEEQEQRRVKQAEAQAEEADDKRAYRTRYEEESTPEWNMQPTQPAHMV